MAILIVVSLAVFGLAFGFAYLRSKAGIEDTWSHDGAGRIADHLQSRNRTTLFVVAVLLLGFTVLEAFIPDFHYVMQDFQYAVGSQRLVAVTVIRTGGGISWGLYLAMLFATLSGTLGGTKFACGKYPKTSGIGIWQLI